MFGHHPFGAHSFSDIELGLLPRAISGIVLYIKRSHNTVKSIMTKVRVTLDKTYRA